MRCLWLPCVVPNQGTRPSFFGVGAAAKRLSTFKPSFCDAHYQDSTPKSFDIMHWACVRCRDNEVGCVMWNCCLLVYDVDSGRCVWRLLLPLLACLTRRYHGNNNQSGWPDILEGISGGDCTPWHEAINAGKSTRWFSEWESRSRICMFEERRWIVA
jgi:hypothetical protein